jgi:hypothetical protein
LGPAAAWFRLAPGRGITPRLAIAAVAFLAALVLGACSSGGSTVNLPPKATPSGTAASPSLSPSPTSARQAAIAAYLGFWTAGSQAERTANAARARAILAPYVTTSYLKYMISSMRPYWRRHEVAWGRNIEHIKKVSIVTSTNGSKAAIVIDCQDASHSGLASARTGKVIRSTLGPRHADLYASMALVSGRWRVAHITFVGNSCTG